ncbi:hypothetical protein HYT25_03685 [Candidatus Pacearchaeota archaeon]|nr:hypothetical protein [Candidatus Pacearchaeota archaeon]
MKLRNLETIREPKSKGNFYPHPISANPVVCYDGDAYLSFVQEVRDVRNSVRDLPEEVREQVNKMLSQVVRGTLDASKVVYDSLIDPAK